MPCNRGGIRVNQEEEKLLRQILREKDLSGRNLASLSGMSAGHVSDLINGKRGFSPGGAQNVYNALGKDSRLSFLSSEGYAAWRVKRSREDTLSSPEERTRRPQENIPPPEEELWDTLYHQKEALLRDLYRRAPESIKGKLLEEYGELKKYYSIVLDETTPSDD